MVVGTKQRDSQEESENCKVRLQLEFVLKQRCTILYKRLFTGRFFTSLSFAEAEPLDFVYLAQDCPHDWLFPQCAAVVSLLLHSRTLITLIRALNNCLALKLEWNTTYLLNLTLTITCNPGYADSSWWCWYCSSGSQGCGSLSVHSLLAVEYSIRAKLYYDVVDNQPILPVCLLIFYLTQSRLFMFWRTFCNSSYLFPVSNNRGAFLRWSILLGEPDTWQGRGTRTNPCSPILRL